MTMMGPESFLKDKVSLEAADCCSTWWNPSWL